MIFRQAAIATAISGRVRTLPTTEDGEDWIRVNEVRDSLLSLPSAQRWIPVTERLPEKHDEVLVTVAGEIVIAWLYLDGRWRSNDCPETYLNDFITAWMPLPEPYREETEDE